MFDSHHFVRRCLHAAAVLSFASCAHAAAPRVILVGDSTMATRTGYGDALCARFAAQVECVNRARGGRSTKSYRAEGLWQDIHVLLAENAKYSGTYVLIQFGHNDQPGKPGRSTDLATEFPVNLASYVQDVKKLGGIPVVLSPLTRRSFQDTTLKNDLLLWADSARKVAQAEGAVFLELNAVSSAAVQAMGQAEADTLAMEPPPATPAASAPADPNKVEPNGAAKSTFDRTHVGAKGAALFSGMVQDLLKKGVPALTPFFK